MPITLRDQHAFQRHLSFFDHNRDGLISPRDSLHAALSLGLDFPVACIWSLIVPFMYGNTYAYTNVSVSSIPPHKQRTMLADLPLQPHKETYSRQEITAIATQNTNDWINWLHVFNLWTLAADRNTGLVSKRDFEMFQQGTLLEELAKRRRVRGRDGGNVMPFVRGGPIWVGGHSFFVGKMFGVEVYRDGDGKRGE